MKPAYLALDTLDDRREIHRLLETLPPRRRVAFLRWCCARAVLPKSGTRPGVSKKTERLARQAGRDREADRRLSLDCYFDVWSLAAQYELDLAAVLERLVALVRGRG